MNKIFIVGNLTKNAETFSTNNGDIYCTSIADNRGEQTNFIDLVFPERFSKVVPYLTKGQKVSVCGSLSIKKTEKDGVTYRNLNVFVDTMELCGGKPNEEENLIGYDKEKHSPTPKKSYARN